VPRKYATMADRLIANSVVSPDQYFEGTPCWIWTGAYTPNGYAKITTRWKQGPRRGLVRTEKAYGVSIKAFKQLRVLKKYVIKHLCNNTCCINPAHLRGGTQRSNIRQCVADGRHKPGTANQHGKFKSR